MIPLQRDFVVKTSKTQWHRIHATYSFVLTTLDCPFNANQLDRLFGSANSRGSVFNKHLNRNEDSEILDRDILRIFNPL